MERLVPREGVEPTLSLEKRILSPPRLPFRHLGTAVGRTRLIPVSYTHLTLPTN